MYQALYRKYRSQTFGQLVGQEVIATTLRQAVEQGKISHAYLFSGPRDREDQCGKNLCQGHELPQSKRGRAL